MPTRREIEFPSVPKIVSEGTVGEARVEHFRVSKADAESYNMRLRWHPGTHGQEIDAGKYARLYVAGHLVMSDTPFERRTNWDFLHEARGDVLVAGLGLGMIVHAALRKPEVTSLTIIEKSADVIRLVGPHFKSPRLTIINADILEWKPPLGQKWDTLYFDIWADTCEDNLTEIAQLHQRFKGRKRAGGWMDSWQRETLRYLRTEGRRYA